MPGSSLNVGGDRTRNGAALSVSLSAGVATRYPSFVDQRSSQSILMYRIQTDGLETSMMAVGFVAEIKVRVGEMVISAATLIGANKAHNSAKLRHICINRAKNRVIFHNQMSINSDETWQKSAISTLILTKLIRDFSS